MCADELARKPDSVTYQRQVDSHPSGPTVAGKLMRSTRELGRAVLKRSRSFGDVSVTKTF